MCQVPSYVSHMFARLVCFADVCAGYVPIYVLAMSDLCVGMCRTCRKRLLGTYLHSWSHPSPLQVSKVRIIRTIEQGR